MVIRRFSTLIPTNVSIYNLCILPSVELSIHRLYLVRTKATTRNLRMIPTNGLPCRSALGHFTFS